MSSVVCAEIQHAFLARKEQMNCGNGVMGVLEVQKFMTVSVPKSVVQHVSAISVSFDVGI